MCWLAIALAALACAGICQAVFGAFAVRRFARRLARPLDAGAARPPVTLLKPLHGDEPMLEAALASLLTQRYGPYQIVFGVQDAADPALAVIERLRARFPAADIAVVVDPTEHGANRKVGNLINMLPSARYDILAIADSDVHVAPDYLDRIVAELAIPGTGLVTTVYAGLPSTASLPATLGATAITHGFLPGALMARELGRQDCLGATMVLRRETLAAIGGFAALVDHIADDHILGKLVRGQGLAVRMAATVTTTTVPETAMPDLFQHELRWARTILDLVPREYALSMIQYPLFWAGLAIGVSGVSGGADWAVAVFLLAWGARAGCAHVIDRCLAASHPGFATPVPVWLLPLRDLMSMFIAIASYGGDRVEWRGRVMHTGRAGPAEALPREPAEYGSTYGPAAYVPATYAKSGYAASSYAPPGPSAAS
jgi:ceramide glucosyltransferase